MDVRLVVGIVFVVAIIAAGAYVAMRGSGGGASTTSASPSTSSSTSPPGGGSPAGSGGTASSPTTSSTSGGEAVVEGSWRGRYSGGRGSGEWMWVIRRTGGGSYEGCLRTTGTYSSGGWMPVSVEVSGSRITVGTVGAGAVVFTGTIQGSSASGEWRFANGMDSGSWEGERTGPVGEMPCAAHSSTATASTGQPPGTAACTPPPPPSYQAAYTALYQASLSVLGEENLRCMTATLIGGVQYAASFMLQGYEPSEAAEVASRLASAAREAGWMNATVARITGDGFLQVVAYGYGGQPLYALLSVQPGGEGGIHYVIQVQMSPG